MLIISQDGTNIVNMNQVASIAITRKGTDIACFYPFLCEGELYYEILGKYSTQERAKAVLQELANTYGNVFKMPVDNERSKTCKECGGVCPYASLEDKYRPRNCDFYYPTILF